MSATSRISTIIVLTAVVSACGPSGPRVEIRPIGSDRALYVDDELVQVSSRALSQPHAWRDASGEQNVAALWTETVGGSSQEFYSIRTREGKWLDARVSRAKLELKNPLDLSSRPAKPVSAKARGLYVAQFHTQILEDYRDQVALAGAEVVRFIPEQALLVRGTAAAMAVIEKLPAVAKVAPLPAGAKLSQAVQNLVRKPRFVGAARFLIVPAAAADVEALRGVILAHGGQIAVASPYLIEAVLPTGALHSVAARAEVAWIDRWTGPEQDMDIVRRLGGADYLESLDPGLPPKYTGIGIRGHVFEGIQPDHPDFAANEYREAPIAIRYAEGPGAEHGQASFGILFGSGAGNSAAKGLMPNGQGLYTNYMTMAQQGELELASGESGGRYELTKELASADRVMFQSASWGSATTLEYDARSAEIDAIAFDLDFAIVQSQSNKGTRRSRPQAWGKNVVSVGAVYHFDNLDWSDDKWAGGPNRASFGPALDGRQKPDLVGFYDSILTTSLGGGYGEFGGTSAATPIVAGHLGLALEIWTNGAFGNPLVAPVSDRFANRPHFTTAKALLINSARQYQFAGADADLARKRQGWGFPDVAKLYQRREKTLVVNEDVVLEVGDRHEIALEVKSDEPSLNVTMTFADPAGVPLARVARINDLDLEVTAPDGTVYHGNHGLDVGMYSVSGGKADDRDTVENVIIDHPAAGVWRIVVMAKEINEDGHKETAALDADFALVVAGGTRASD